MYSSTLSSLCAFLCDSVPLWLAPELLEEGSSHGRRGRDRAGTGRHGDGGGLATGAARRSRPGPRTVLPRPRPRQLARPHAHHPPGLLRTPLLRPPRPPRLPGLVRPRTDPRATPAHLLPVPDGWQDRRRVG